MTNKKLALPAKAKLPYSSPQLKTHGSVAVLTRGSVRGSLGDMFGSMAAMGT